MSDSETDPVVEKALKLFELSAEAFSQQRKRELDDLKFQVPELQWTTDETNDRAGDAQGRATGGIPTPPRPMISINQLDQPVQLVQGQQRSAHLGVQIDPLDEKATTDTAEILQDHIRAIDRESNSEQVRSWSFDRSLKCGISAYRMLPVYDEASSDPWDKKIILKRILNPATVYLDPFATEPDFSDGRFAFITEDMSWDRYKEEFPDSKLAQYDSMDFESIGDVPQGWMGGDEEGRTVRIAEYFQLAFKDDPSGLLRLVKFADGRTDTIEGEGELPAGASLVAKRKRQQPYIIWRKINCVETLDETDLPDDCPYIPILVTIGRELQMFDNQRRWVGMYTNGKGPQRLLNYSASNLVERMASQTKAPWLLAEGQEEGHEVEFAVSAVRNLPYLRYKPTTLEGKLVKEPTRNLQSVDISSEVMLIEQSKQFIQTVTAVHEPSLGQESSRAKSGRAILALQQQGDMSTSGYVMNLAEITMRHEARLLLKWIPYYYDREGRVVQTRKVDGTMVPVMLNAPYTMGKNGRPVKAIGPNGKGVKHYNLKEGSYSVAVTVGRSYQTRLAEGADALGRILEAHQEMMPILGPIWLQFQDWPGHDEAAELLKKMQPPQLREGKDGEPDPQAVQAENAQLKQAIQELTAGLKEAHQIIETKSVEQQGKIAETQVDGQTKVEIERIKADQQLRLENLKFQHELALKRFELTGKRFLQDDQQAHELGLAAADARQAEQEAERAENQMERSAAREMASGVAGEQREDQRTERSANREDARARESADREDMRSEAEREAAAAQQESALE